MVGEYGGCDVGSGVVEGVSVVDTGGWVWVGEWRVFVRCGYRRYGVCGVGRRH